MSSTGLTALFDGLLDDAAMFPPEDAPLADAVAGHAAHRLAWYGDLVASFVCAAGLFATVGTAGLIAATGICCEMRRGGVTRGAGSSTRRAG